MVKIEFDDRKVSKYPVISFEFHEGFAKVCNYQGLHGFINLKGEEICELKYWEVNNFQNGLASVRAKETGLWGVIDTTGKEVIPCEFEYLLNFSKEGLCGALVSDYNSGIKSRKWGYINIKGEFVIPPIFDGVGTFNDGYAVVLDDTFGKQYYINTDGERVSESYDICTPFKNGYGYAKRSNMIFKLNQDMKTEKFVLDKNLDIDFSKHGIERHGKFIVVYNLFAVSNRVYLFNENLDFLNKNRDLKILAIDDNTDFCLVSKMGEWRNYYGQIDKNAGTYYTLTTDGEFIKAPDGLLVKSPVISEGVIGMNDGNAKTPLVALFDKNWKPYYTIYDSVDSVSDRNPSDGLVITRGLRGKDIRFGYSDLNKNIILPHRYRAAYRFTEGVATVILEDGQKACIDKTGNVLFTIPELYKSTVNVDNRIVEIYADDEIKLGLEKIGTLNTLLEQITRELSHEFSEKIRKEMKKVQEKSYGQKKI